MKKRIYQSSVSPSNKKLMAAFRADPTLLDEVVDAQICNQISSELYSLRHTANITQSELAERLGVKQSNISRWETPGYQGYKVKMLSKIARALGGGVRISIMPIHNTYQSLVHLGRSEDPVIAAAWYRHKSNTLTKSKELNNAHA